MEVVAAILAARSLDISAALAAAEDRSMAGRFLGGSSPPVLLPLDEDGRSASSNRDLRLVPTVGFDELMLANIYIACDHPLSPNLNPKTKDALFLDSF
jgi:hypothetical protein